MKFHHLALLVAVLHIAGNVANTTTCSNNGDLAENAEEDRNLAEKLDGHAPPDNSDPFYYTAGEVASGGLAAAIGYSGRPYTTESIIRHLPALDGYMQTCNTYRHLMVREQVFTMIGEVKHGLWQVQESGFIREYLRAGATGLPSAMTQANASLDLLMMNYSSYLPDPEVPANWAGYAYPSDRINQEGTLQYIDLPISHAKYQGKYNDHVPIDLRLWYCTMSEPLFPNAASIMEYIYAQPGANVIGALGKRAGLDLRELYTNVVRIHTFPDARAWVNIGPKFTDTMARNKEIGAVHYVAVDHTRTFSEYYLVERPFKNVMHQFVVAVFDDALGTKSTHSYIRPDGAYWESLLKRGYKLDDFNTEVKQPQFYYTVNTKITNPNGALGEMKVDEPGDGNGLPLYGGHGLNRADVTGGGGACPMRGGDWAHYPLADGGGGWPTQYQEVTPMCDAILLDIKLFGNLHNNPANDATVGLPHSGRGVDPVKYDLLSYPIGAYDTENDIGGSTFLSGKTNPDYFDYTALLPPEGQPGDKVALSFTYTHPLRQYISYIGEKPAFPLPFAEPEPGCCERIDSPYMIHDEEATDDETGILKSDGISD